MYVLYKPRLHTYAVKSRIPVFFGVGYLYILDESHAHTIKLWAQIDIALNLVCVCVCVCVWCDTVCGQNLCTVIE